jgi:hypothetical protein
MLRCSVPWFFWRVAGKGRLRVERWVYGTGRRE